MSDPSRSSTKKVKSSTGSFHFFGKGLVALLALIALGGGVFAFYSLRNQNNPVFNVEGGKGGEANVSLTNELGDTNITTTEGKSGQVSSASDSPNKTNVVDMNAVGTQWNLSYPIYQQQDGTPIYEQQTGGGCVLVGQGSIGVVQRENGSLAYGGNLNGYRGGSIQGTITATGRTRLNIAAGPGANFFITLVGEDVQQFEETTIAGKATAPNCPETSFELVRMN